ncbi:MAG: hypothetical protein LBV00_12780 [Propionibacteriaceae bacterium]|nr:hypothetical protein [Propionibacteriaceae bacterium]
MATINDTLAHKTSYKRGPWVAGGTSTSLREPTGNSSYTKVTDSYERRSDI